MIIETTEMLQNLWKSTNYIMKEPTINLNANYVAKHINLADNSRRGPFGRRHLSAANWVSDNWAPCRMGAGHLVTISQFFYFLSYE